MPFDPTTRCQHCGDTLRNHKGRACKGLSSRGKTFTAWTHAAYAKAEIAGKLKAAQDSATVDLRRLYPFAPWRVARYTPPGSTEATYVEITSYPFVGEDGVTRVMARRVIGDPTTNTELHATDLQEWAGSVDEMRGYRDGFLAGYEAACQAARELHATEQTGGAA